jgi:hypothetical protein
MPKSRARLAEAKKFIPVLILFGLTFLILGKTVFLDSNRLLSSESQDMEDIFYPMHQTVFEHLKHGHLMLWNPYLKSGIPFLANFEFAIFYPPNWIFMLFSSVFAMNLSIFLHVFLAGFFTYWWLSRRGFRWEAALFAAITYMFGGPYFSHLYAGHFSNLCTMAWAPCILGIIDRISEEKNPFRWLWAGIAAVALQLLAGHVQYFFYTSFMVFFYTLFQFGLGGWGKIKGFISVFSMYLGGMLLTAVQWMTGLQAVFGESTRGTGVSILIQQATSLPKKDLLTLILPCLYGKSAHYSCLENTCNWWEVSLFCGIAAAFISLYGVVCKREKQTSLFLGLAVFSLIMALGFHTPVYRFFYHLVPLFQFFRGVYKFNILFGLFLSALIAIGCDTLMNQVKYPRWPILLGILSALIMGVLSFHYFQLFDRLQAPSLLQTLTEAPVQDDEKAFPQHIASRFFYFGEGAVLCLAFALIWFWMRWNRKAVYALLVLGLVEILTYAAFTHQSFCTTRIEQRISQARQFQAQNPGDYRVGGKVYSPLIPAGLNVLWSGDPVILKRYFDFLAYTYHFTADQLMIRSFAFQTYPKIMGLTRLKFDVKEESGGLVFKPLDLSPLPRMLLLGRYCLVGGEQQGLETLGSLNFDPFREVVLEQKPFPEPDPAGSPGRVEWMDISTESIEVMAEVPAPKILLVTDNYSSGWHIGACPDSIQQAYTLMPGDVIHRAVPLSAGKHHFFMKYEPVAFVVGKWVSLVSLTVYLCLLAFGFKLRNRLPKRSA